MSAENQERVLENVENTGEENSENASSVSSSPASGASRKRKSPSQNNQDDDVDPGPTPTPPKGLILRREAIFDGFPQYENMFQVEKVLKKRIVDGKVQYYLKWEGYTKKHNSWEPEENLSPKWLAWRAERLATQKSAKRGTIVAATRAKPARLATLRKSTPRK